MNQLAAILPQLLLALIGGGLLGTVLTHRRLAPKSEAEKNDMDWTRFQREIARLDAKVTAQGQRIDELERDLMECHRKHDESDRQLSEARAEILKMRAVAEGLGEARQHAAVIVAADRLERKDVGR